MAVRGEVRPGRAGGGVRYPRGRGARQGGGRGRGGGGGGGERVDAGGGSYGGGGGLGGLYPGDEEDGGLCRGLVEEDFAGWRQKSVCTYARSALGFKHIGKVRRQFKMFMVDHQIST